MAQPVVPGGPDRSRAAVVATLSLAALVAAILLAAAGHASQPGRVAATSDRADVAVRASAAGSASVGEQLAYELTVANAGPVAAQDVAVTDTLPAQVSFDSASASRGRCRPAATSTVECALGEVAGGETATVTITVTAQTPTSAATNTAQVTAATRDPNSGNNDGSTDTTITERPLGCAPDPADSLPAGVSRLSGRERIATAIRVSRQSCPDGAAGAVVLARADLFPDALSGTPLAVQADGPILFSATQALPAATEAELQRVLPSGGTVYLLGQTAALGVDVADRVAALGYDPVRLGGATRFATAATIAERGLDDPDSLLITDGADFPDAITGATGEAVAGGVLLTAGTHMPEVTQRYLDGRTDDPDRFAIGGPASTAAPDATPVVGATRFATSVAVAERFFSSPSTVGIATGGGFADALAGGALMGKLGGPMLLTGPDTLPPVVETYLADHAASIDRAVVYGGTAAVSQDVAARLDDAITTVAEAAGPAIRDVTVRPASATAAVSWDTDVPASSRVTYGTTPRRERAAADPGGATLHRLPLDDAACDTTHHYQVSSAHDTGRTTAPAGAFATSCASGPDDTGRLALDVWYGSPQRFGHLGNPQRQVALAGRVTGDADVASLSYTLNGGPAREVTVGPDDRRLADPGDFVIELDRDELVAGDNDVAITATEAQGPTVTTTVTVAYTAGETWPLGDTTSWSAPDVLDEAEPVDGRWIIQGDRVRTAQLGYDRLLAVGDRAWTDYEATVAITLHELDPTGEAAEWPSDGSALGLAVRWRGHGGSMQPATEFWPTGAFAWHRWRDGARGFSLRAANTATLGPSDHRGPAVTFQEGDTWVYKVRVRTQPDGTHRYRFRMWRQGEPEPDAWPLSIEAPADHPASGSLLLLAHEVDASFGPVTVEPVP